MNLGTYDITIDFSKLFFHNNTSIYFKEGDLNTAKVRAKLTMQRKVIDITGCNVVVKIETTTGRKINDVATIVDATNGIIEIDFKSNSLIEGTNFFELKIVKGESVKESAKLAYRVLDSIEDAGSIEGTNEYPILVQLIRDVNKAIANADRTLNIATDMQSDLDITINKANTAIANAKDATDKANESVENINRAIAAGTQDLEVKAAREDVDGVVHNTLNERLENDLKIGSKSLKQEVLDLAGLKESQDMAYSTDKGYLVCKETKNGTVKDLKISGRTIKNLIGVNGKSSFTLNSSVKSRQYILSEIIKANTTMYFRVNITSKKAPLYGLRVVLKNTDGTYSYYDGTKGVYNQSFKITHDKDINSIGLYMPNAEFESTPDANITYEKFQVNLAEAYDYFEVIASVGDGTDGIEVLSNNSNLINIIDKELISYVPHKSDKKPLLFKDVDATWKPIRKLRSIKDICDSVERGKYFNRIGVQAISANITLKTNYANLDYVSVPKPIDSIFYNTFNVDTVITDSKFNCYNDPISNWDSSSLIGYFSTAPSKTSIWFGVPKGTTLEQAREMLVGKTMLYQLAEERVFEVNPLFLEAFEGGTLVFVNSGVINAPIEFKIASYITNLVLLNQQRISLIEQEMFNMFKQVLSGDMYSLAEKLYPEDFIEEKYIATPIPEL